MTMSCAVPIPRLLLCAAFLTSADAAGISSLLPHHILMNTSIIVDNPPMKMDHLSVRWVHKGRTLVEYKDGNLTFYSPFAVMSLEQLKQGNISLVLTNLTLNDAGNYTCLVQYIGVEQTAAYHLIIERNRIRLLNLTPPPQKGVSLVKSTKKGPSLDVEGEKSVTARLGNNVTLPCRFKMDRTIEQSMLNVHWLKDGVTTYFSNKSCCNIPGYGISEEDLQNGLAPLQLVDVQEEDAGMYTCTIKYEAVERSWNTRFQLVKSTQEPTSLHVKGYESVTARPGDNVTLPCRFEMDPGFELSELTVHWLKDEVTKHFSNKTCCNISSYKISEEALQEGSAPLPLINVQEKDAGIYRCSIKYKAMEESWITTLHIGPSTTTGQPTSTSTGTMPPPVVPQYRTLKLGLILGALAVTGLVAAFVYICFKG
ncbi:carcinoembryonic antigen-related cell adhesion molecule 5-like isoform X2 [Eleutherodactylus coqui]|uniref:carcinoembryonic antigen-related cell adhesion molecule 5-like isoform X2 n=1 Tax=Eleutherodactylus coqui TaxID=57060 RepID=UPI003462AD90